MFKTVLAAALLIAASPVTGTACRTYDKMFEFLSQTQGQRVTAWGLASAGGIVEVWQNDLTWTIVVIDTRKRSCIVAEGEGWQNYRPAKSRPRV